jgi:replicative superfamily II helicase
MRILNYGTPPINEDVTQSKLYRYIQDERLLRVLLEQGIFALRDIQKEAIEQGLFFRKSFLISSPSGSGKTLVGELCATQGILQGFGKAVYLVPFKALATEKFGYFKKYYERFGLKIVLSIGDQEPEETKLKQADLIITTYEKMDSILRNFQDKKWIVQMSTVVIDEIHMIGESDRGPRLESLIVRLNEFLKHPQIIGLSATIANPQFLAEWMSSLGNHTTLIYSDERPVPLHFHLEITQNKDLTLMKIVKRTLEEKGQVLVFVNKRKSTQSLALHLSRLVGSQLTSEEKTACKRLETIFKNVRGGVLDLSTVVKHGIAFHHAGLLSKERKVVEDAFRQHLIKVVICTTTLSAGINMPARVVVLHDFKRYVTSGSYLKNFKGFYETGDGFSFFKPFSANEVFQMLGRAGRPGYDSVGYGIILVNEVKERDWVEDHYFTNALSEEQLKPKYNALLSGLNSLNLLKEQVLLRIYEEKRITHSQLKCYFERTYFWHSIKQRMEQHAIPIEQLLMIEEINPVNILKLHSNPERVKKLVELSYPIKITSLTRNAIGGYIKTDYGVYHCEFSMEEGIRCSCNFHNGISDGYAGDEFSFEFCDHVTIFLLYLLKHPDPRLLTYVNDIVPRCLKNQYILNYLFEKGLILENEDGTLSCAHFGKLIIRLYMLPISGVLLRYKLENCEILSYQDMIREAFDILTAEGRVRNHKMVIPILEWTDEEPLETIIEHHHIMAGDLHAVKDNLERVITFMGIVAQHLSETGSDLKDKLAMVADMAETLRVRVHFGIKDELFDLVLHLPNVARVRARILYAAGYTTASKVKKENPYLLHRKTGIGLNICNTLTKDTF